ncbi:proline-rich protein HaeIII subfamily 1-like isoform X1 [Dreissena polymorpha]|uniref:proline-rich protein HaeIII subfamily 1-like isoform X1 n=1 Tax=Dreissena polymorpha TaxID=45954 RepID=UPI0022649298|nr:proline-rich protein HaeIII subfamily 1-like isoform X1 [Dreissena polymorpha]
MQSPPQSQPPSVLPQSQPPPSYEEVQAMSAVQGHQPYLGPQGYKPEWGGGTAPPFSTQVGPGPYPPQPYPFQNYPPQPYPAGQYPGPPYPPQPGMPYNGYPAQGGMQPTPEQLAAILTGIFLTTVITCCNWCTLVDKKLSVLLYLLQILFTFG